MKRWMSAAALGALAAACLTSPAFAADRVSGVLTATFVIVDNTDHIRDVRGVVAKNTGCGGASSTGAEAGIGTNGMSRVAVRGPGLVQRFRGDGVTVAGSTDARVEDLTLSTNCMSGVRVLGTSFGTLVQNNVAVRNGSPAASCGGI